MEIKVTEAGREREERMIRGNRGAKAGGGRGRNWKERG